jgi:hypothetical protein
MKGRCSKCGAKNGGHVCTEGLLQLQRDIRMAEMRLARLKDSIASHERAERLVYDRYVALAEKARQVEVYGIAEKVGL